MAIPRMTDLFLRKESVDTQHWTSNGNRYNVGKLYRWARQNGHDIEIIPVSQLTKGFEHTNTDEEKGSDEFWKRADEAGDDPILVVVDEKRRWWIADGNHRFARYQRDGATHIRGHILMESELPRDAIEPKKSKK